MGPAHSWPQVALLHPLGPSPPYQPGIPLLTVGEEIKVQQGEPLASGTQLCAKPQLLGYDTSVVSREYIIAAILMAVKRSSV